MARIWKVVLPLALALPMLAYVAGTLVAAGEEPHDRSPIVVEDPSPGSGNDPTDGPTKKKQKNDPGDRPTQHRGDDGDDKGDDDGRADDDGDDDGPEVVTPEPDDLDDDNGDDGDDDGGDDGEGGDD